MQALHYRVMLHNSVVAVVGLLVSATMATAFAELAGLNISRLTRMKALLHSLRRRALA